jgi:hypothetical protein
MMAETVIKLRRSLFGFRETRFQGAYCAPCGIGVTIDSLPAVRPPRRVSSSGVRRICRVWPIKLPLLPVSASSAS